MILKNLYLIFTDKVMILSRLSFGSYVTVYGPALPIVDYCFEPTAFLAIFKRLRQAQAPAGSDSGHEWYKRHIPASASWDQLQPDQFRL